MCQIIDFNLKKAVHEAERFSDFLSKTSFSDIGVIDDHCAMLVRLIENSLCNEQEKNILKEDIQTAYNVHIMHAMLNKI